MTITWRTVTGPSIADALKPMEAAQDSFNSMFDNFNTQLEKRQAANAFREGLREEEAVQGYLDQIHGADLDQLEKMHQSGQLAQLRQGLSAKARAQVRGADEERISSLRDQITQGQAFGDGQDERRFDPLRDEYQQILYTKGPEAAQSFLEEAKKTHGLNKVGQHYQEIDSRTEVLNNRELAEENQNNARTDRNIRNFETLSEANQRTATELASLEQGSIGSPDGMGKLVKLLSDALPDKENIVPAIGLLNTAITSNPLFKSLPTSAVEQIMLKHTPQVGSMWTSNSAIVQNMTADLTQALEDNKEVIMANEVARSNLINRRRLTEAQQEEAERVAFPQYFGNSTAPQAQGGETGAVGQPGEEMSDAAFKAAMEQARVEGRLPPAFDRQAGTGMEPAITQPPVENLDAALRSRLKQTEADPEMKPVPPEPPKMSGLTGGVSAEWKQWYKETKEAREHNEAIKEKRRLERWEQFQEVKGK